MTQKQKVLKWLKSGRALTPIQALEQFGSFRLGAIIHELRNEGYEIKTTLIKNRYGNQFAKYKLIQKARGKL